MISEALQNNALVFRMLFLSLGINQDVVNENHDKLIQLRHEYRVHEIYLK